ncbi:TIGR04282 family arsenosugar biosynthesis glycosyltransferase [Leptospira idonii]|uniref:Glycosyltransferase n=1 Tax=Leptospira idonii TaxID=1193500 RepID=A0A4R9M7T1_9LEPT|nr:TIGR04282 family arsenosugar biosynthesis glycosyltransferase [Leptospira idonii]TGN21129.1 glycosyltransferase [Leptospira idonii]
MENKALIIFAKKPELGKVKTRLAKDLGETEALLAYERLLKITEDVTEGSWMKKYLFWEGEIPKQSDFFSSGYVYKSQKNGDLGFKMKSAFEEILPLHSQVCIIGTDCPYLDESILKTSFDLLENDSDLVIGPAMDGGYYLLGMRKLHGEVFEGVEWSTDRVFATTVSIAIEKRLTVKELPKLRDIDTIEDYYIWKN